MGESVLGGPGKFFHGAHKRVLLRGTLRFNTSTPQGMLLELNHMAVLSIIPSMASHLSTNGIVFHLVWGLLLGGQTTY